MTIDENNGDEKFQYDINRVAATISALLSGTIDKYQHQTGEKIITTKQHRIIEEAKFFTLHSWSPYKNKQKQL